MKKNLAGRSKNSRFVFTALIVVALIAVLTVGLWRNGILFNDAKKETPQAAEKEIVVKEQAKAQTKEVTKSEAKKEQPKLKKGAHPYGNPAQGALPWENNATFKKQCAKYNAKIRMAAFQTTLPDPLPGEEENVRIGAEKMAGTVVQPGGILSMNNAIGPYTSEHGYKYGPTYAGNKVIKTVGGGVCKIASTLYNVAILADMQIVERHNHAMLVPYVPPGQDATVYYGVLDIKFRNNTGAPLIIWSETNTKTNTLYMAIYGSKKPPVITWGHAILKREPYKTTHIFNSNLQSGEEKIIIPGADGLTVKSWLQIKRNDGTTETKQLGVDHYQQMPKVIERGAPK